MSAPTRILNPTLDGLPMSGQFAGMDIKTRRLLSQAQSEENTPGARLMGSLQQLGQTGTPGFPSTLSMWMMAILAFQAMSCALRTLVLKDYTGAVWMILLVAVGAYAWRQDMNVMYTTIWGLMCMVNGVVSFIGLGLPIVLGIKHVKAFEVGVSLLIPVSYLLGGIFAVHLYQVSADHDQGDKEAPGMPPGTTVESLGRAFDSRDPFGLKADYAKELQQEALARAAQSEQFLTSAVREQTPLKPSAGPQRMRYAACC